MKIVPGKDEERHFFKPTIDLSLIGKLQYNSIQRKDKASTSQATPPLGPSMASPSQHTLFTGPSPSFEALAIAYRQLDQIRENLKTYWAFAKERDEAIREFYLSITPSIAPVFPDFPQSLLPQENKDSDEEEDENSDEEDEENESSSDED